MYLCNFFPGKVFPLKGEAELVEFTKLVNTSLKHDTAIASGGTSRGRVKQSTLISHVFSVDDGINTVTVSIVVGQPNMISQVSLIGPGNVKVNPQTTTSMSMIFDILNPKAGRYQLIFPNTGGNMSIMYKAFPTKLLSLQIVLCISEVSVGIVLQFL